MAIVKQVSFKEKEKELFDYANNHGNFSEYVKGLIQADMNNPVSGAIRLLREQSGNTIDTITRESINALMKQEETKQDNFVIEAEREDLEL